MKLKRLLSLAAVTLGAALLSLSGARAATVSLASDELFLAFRTNDGSASSDLVVSLGKLNSILALAPGATYNFNANGTYSTYGLSSADLTTAFGEDWNLSSTLSWSVGGGVGGSANNTLYVSSLGVPSRRSATQQNNNVLSRIQTILSASGESTNGNLHSLLQSAGSPTGYSDQIDGAGNNLTSSYGHNWGATPYIEAGVSDTGSIIANFYSVPFLNSGSGTGTLLGYFTLGSNGSFTYTTVPEPSAALLLGAAALPLLAARRRRKQAENA